MFHSFLEQFRDSSYDISFSPKVDQWKDSIVLIEHIV